MLMMNTKSDYMQRTSPIWVAKMVEVSGSRRGFAHNRKPSGNAMLDLTRLSGIGVDIAWLGGVLNVAWHDDQHPLVCIDHVYLSGDATLMLVAKDRRTGMQY